MSWDMLNEPCPWWFAFCAVRFGDAVRFSCVSTVMTWVSRRCRELRLPPSRVLDFESCDVFIVWVLVPFLFWISREPGIPLLIHFYSLNVVEISGNQKWEENEGWIAGKSVFRDYCIRMFVWCTLESKCPRISFNAKAVDGWHLDDSVALRWKGVKAAEKS